MLILKRLEVRIIFKSTCLGNAQNSISRPNPFLRKNSSYIFKLLNFWNLYSLSLLMFISSCADLQPPLRESWMSAFWSALIHFPWIILRPALVINAVTLKIAHSTITNIEKIRKERCRGFEWLLFLPLSGKIMIYLRTESGAAQKRPRYYWAMQTNIFTRLHEYTSTIDVL